MLYLIRSYGPSGKSILKVGFSDNPDNRFSQYFYHNPYSEVILTKEGDDFYESLLHIYLTSLGYSFTLDDRLSEWYKDVSEVIDIFNLSLEELSDKMWEDRDKIFDPKKLRINKKTDFTYRIFKFLYVHHRDDFYPEEFKIEGEIIKKIDDYKEVDEVFLEVYKSLNPPEVELPDIYSEENLKIASEFLDNYFYSTGVFRDKLRMYCEFCDYYKDNSEVMDILNHRVGES